MNIDAAVRRQDVKSAAFCASRRFWFIAAARQHGKPRVLGKPEIVERELAPIKHAPPLGADGSGMAATRTKSYAEGWLLRGAIGKIHVPFWHGTHQNFP